MPVATTDPRVTAVDPGAFLDAEAWVFTVTFNDPGTNNPIDLTGSRLFVTFATRGPAGQITIQTCDSAASDGSLVIALGTGGQATFSAYPEARTWKPPRLGLALSLAAVVEGDVYRQVAGGEPVALTSLRVLVKPTTGAPTGRYAPPSPVLSALLLSSISADAGALFSATIIGKTAGSTITATSNDGMTLSVTGSTISGRFMNAGTPTVTLTETLAGATGSPKQTTVQISVAATVIASAAIAAGQPVVVLAVPPGAQPASSVGLSSAYVEGLATSAVASGYPVSIQRETLALPDWTAVVGTAQLAIGRDYFLALNGTLSLLPDVTTGHCTVKVGRAVNATTLILDISPPFLN